MRGRGDSPPLKAPSEHLGRTGGSRPALSHHNLLHGQPTCPLAGPESVSGYPECPIEIKVKAHEHSGREGKVIPGLIKQQLSREATRILKRPFRLPRMSILLLRVTSLKVGWGKAAPPPHGSAATYYIHTQMKLSTILWEQMESGCWAISPNVAYSDKHSSDVLSSHTEAFSRSRYPWIL